MFPLSLVTKKRKRKTAWGSLPNCWPDSFKKPINRGPDPPPVRKVSKASVNWEKPVPAGPRKVLL
jgi:hypothetical protein